MIWVLSQNLQSLQTGEVPRAGAHHPSFASGRNKVSKLTVLITGLFFKKAEVSISCLISDKFPPFLTGSKSSVM